MTTQTTHGISVSVDIFYRHQCFLPEENKFFFAYKVRIENQSETTVQLLSRRWKIFDSNNLTRFKEGEGPVEEQPVLTPGQAHEYVSWCDLETEIGKMEGTYLMQNDKENRFRVRIPPFDLVASYRMN